MRILLTNDDGINAAGYRAIFRALSACGHDVLPVAPMQQQSNVSNHLTVRQPLTLHAVRDGQFLGLAVDGTPGDCVRVALAECYAGPAEQPDLVVSGINDGHNIGTDVFYSGTVSAALNGALCGIPSLAVSRRYTRETDIEAVAEHAARFINALDWNAFKGKLLNLNYPEFPLSELKGIRVCPLSTVSWPVTYHSEKPENGCQRLYVDKISYNADTPVDPFPSDWSLIRQGYATLTPIITDPTDHGSLESLSQSLEQARLG